MTEPVVGILTDAAKSYSRPRFAEEASALGLTVRFLDPSHFDLLVDAKQLKTFYRNRPLTPPDAFMARTGGETGQFAQAIIKQMESTSGVAVINSLDSIHLPSSARPASGPLAVGNG